jgi:hypothetical protein
MACEKCKKRKDEITLSKFGNYTIDELKIAAQKFNLPSYTPDEIAFFYNLYNRVYQKNEQPGGCGQCFQRIRAHLHRRYNAEKDGE